MNSKQVADMSADELQREIAYLRQLDERARVTRLDEFQHRFDGCDYLRIIQIREELNRRKVCEQGY